MSTADTLVKRALNSIKAHSDLNPADASILEIAWQQLVALIEGFLADEVYFGPKVAITSAGTVATVTLVGHEFIDGREVVIHGAAETGYNGRFVITSVPDADTFTYDLAEAQDSPATPADAARGITALVIPGALAEQVREQGGATIGLQALLAEIMAPICSKPIPQAVLDAARDGQGDIEKRYQAPTIPSMVPSRLAPRGQGAQRGPMAPAHFSGDALDADSSS